MPPSFQKVFQSKAFPSRKSIESLVCLQTVTSNIISKSLGSTSLAVLPAIVTVPTSCNILSPSVLLAITPLLSNRVDQIREEIDELEIERVFEMGDPDQVISHTADKHYQEQIDIRNKAIEPYQEKSRAVTNPPSRYSQSQNDSDNHKYSYEDQQIALSQYLEERSIRGQKLQCQEDERSDKL